MYIYIKSIISIYNIISIYMYIYIYIIYIYIFTCIIKNTCKFTCIYMYHQNIDAVLYIAYIHLNAVPTYCLFFF